MHTVFALLCFVVVIHWLIFPYPSGLLHCHCGNLRIAPVPAKQPWWIWIHTSCEFIMNDCITTTKQSTTKPCAYFLGYTGLRPVKRSFDGFSDFGLNKRLSKQSWGGWFETPSRPLWRHRNAKLWYCFWHTSPHMASQKAVINWSITRRVAVIKSIDRYPPIPAVTGFVSQTLTSSLLRPPLNKQAGVLLQDLVRSRCRGFKFKSI